MADDRRLDTLQDEIKLLKGELKNSLASVRDYLLNMELPSSEFSTILAALSGDGNTMKVTLDGAVGSARPPEPAVPDASDIEEETEEGAGEEVTDELPPEDEDLIDVGGPEEGEEVSDELEDGTPSEEEEILNPEDELLSDEESLGGGEGLSSEDSLLPEEEVEEGEDVIEPEATNEEEEEENTPESELSAEEDQRMESDRTTPEINQGIPKVNMLANLINWVARAKTQIGYEELATFLEVYGISGHLTPELKEVIIHLAEITRERPENETDADIWSEAMLSLHGILTGGDAPLHPVIPSWEETTDEAETPEEEIIEIDKSKEKPVKLKLVFPNGNGKNKEFCIDLTPDGDNGSS